MSKPVEQLDHVIIRFAGDSGDGMQLTGGAVHERDGDARQRPLDLPDFPAEIRAPAGSLPGVSGFQVHFADHDILTPGDAPNVLVAMNPAALKTNIKDLREGGTLIVNMDAFKARNLEKAGYTVSPLEDGSLDEYQVHEVPLTSMTIEALKEFEVTKREAERSKNMFALGLMSWLFTRPTEGTIAHPREEVRDEAGDRQGEHPRLPGRLCVRRDLRGVHRAVRGQAGEARARDVPQRDGEPGARDGSRRRERAERAPALPRRVSDHPGVGNAGGALALQALRHPHLPGRGRDRRRRRITRRVLRRLARDLDLERPGRRRSRSETIGLAVALELPLLDPGHPARRPVDGDADEAGAGRPDARAVRAQCRVAGSRRRGRDSGRTASTPRSRRRASRSSTARRSSSLSDAYLANGSEPWLIPDASDLPDISVAFAASRTRAAIPPVPA